MSSCGVHDLFLETKDGIILENSDLVIKQGKSNLKLFIAKMRVCSTQKKVKTVLNALDNNNNNLDR